MQSLPQCNSLFYYQIVDVKTGHWEKPKNNETSSHALQTFTTHLLLRIEKVVKQIVTEIENAMSKKISARHSYNRHFLEKIKTIKWEIQTHAGVCDRFAMSLKREFGEIHTIKKCCELLERMLSVLDTIVKSWEELLKLYNESNQEFLIEKMKDIKINLDTFRKDPDLYTIYEAFFYLDDATRGLIRNKLAGHVAIHEGHALEKFIDCIMRQMIKGINAYSNNDESKMINAVFEKIREFGGENDPYAAKLRNLHLLLKQDDRLYEGLF